MAHKILIVDDALFMRSMLKDILVSAGYDIIGEAERGTEAVEKYKALQPDLVTMDIVMREGSSAGIDATREILKHNSKAAVIMCSGLGQEAQVMEAIEAGALDYVVKPFRSEDVVAVVKKILG